MIDSLSWGCFYTGTHYNFSSERTIKHRATPAVVRRECQGWSQIASHLPQTGQIWDFLSTETDLKSPRFVLFGSNLTQFGCQIWHHWNCTNNTVSPTMPLFFYVLRSYNFFSVFHFLVFQITTDIFDTSHLHYCSIEYVSFNMLKLTSSYNNHNFIL